MYSKLKQRNFQFVIIFAILLLEITEYIQNAHAGVIKRDIADSIASSLNKSIETDVTAFGNVTTLKSTTTVVTEALNVQHSSASDTEHGKNTNEKILLTTNIHGAPTPSVDLKTQRKDDQNEPMLEELELMKQDKTSPHVRQSAENLIDVTTTSIRRSNIATPKETTTKYPSREAAISATTPQSQVELNQIEQQRLDVTTDYNKLSVIGATTPGIESEDTTRDDSLRFDINEYVNNNHQSTQTPPPVDVHHGKLAEERFHISDYEKEFNNLNLTTPASYYDSIHSSNNIQDDDEVIDKIKENNFPKNNDQFEFDNDIKENSTNEVNSTILIDESKIESTNYDIATNEIKNFTFDKSPQLVFSEVKSNKYNETKLEIFPTHAKLDSLKDSVENYEYAKETNGSLVNKVSESSEPHSNVTNKTEKLSQWSEIIVDSDSAKESSNKSFSSDSVTVSPNSVENILEPEKNPSRRKTEQLQQENKVIPVVVAAPSTPSDIYNETITTKLNHKSINSLALTTPSIEGNKIEDVELNVPSKDKENRIFEKIVAPDFSDHSTLAETKKQPETTTTYKTPSQETTESNSAKATNLDETTQSFEISHTDTIHNQESSSVKATTTQPATISVSSNFSKTDFDEITKDFIEKLPSTTIFSARKPKTTQSKFTIELPSDISTNENLDNLQTTDFDKNIEETQKEEEITRPNQIFTITSGEATQTTEDSTIPNSGNLHTTVETIQTDVTTESSIENTLHLTSTDSIKSSVQETTDIYSKTKLDQTTKPLLLPKDDNELPSTLRIDTTTSDSVVDKTTQVSEEETSDLNDVGGTSAKLFENETTPEITTLKTFNNNNTIIDDSEETTVRVAKKATTLKTETEKTEIDVQNQIVSTTTIQTPDFDKAFESTVFSAPTDEATIQTISDSTFDTSRTTPSLVTETILSTTESTIVGSTAIRPSTTEIPESESFPDFSSETTSTHIINTESTTEHSSNYKSTTESVITFESYTAQTIDRQTTTETLSSTSLPIDWKSTEKSGSTPLLTTPEFTTVSTDYSTSKTTTDDSFEINGINKVSVITTKQPAFTSPTTEQTMVTLVSTVTTESIPTSVAGGLSTLATTPVDEYSTTASVDYVTPTVEFISSTRSSEIQSTDNIDSSAPEETDYNVIIAISVAIVAIIVIVLGAVFFYVMRKRQKQITYGQRCRPVSLDAYSLDNVSVFNSVRRKGALRASKRTYGNVAFDDPSLKHNVLTAQALGKYVENKTSIRDEFGDVPQVIARPDEVPPGCEDKNRYANVIPLPETRVVLEQQNDDEKTEYINANFVRGPKDEPNYYIACQAPLESTVADFWRMIWEQNSRVIIMATDLIENGIEKCAEYLPASMTLDNHIVYGDYQITLKNREVKEKYAVSTLHVKNMLSNTWREVTHFWYQWPESGVPGDESSVIAMLLEARTHLKSSVPDQNENEDDKKEEKQQNGKMGKEINENSEKAKITTTTTKTQGPLTVHCSPGTGRTGTLIACDIAIRSLELPKRSVDIPQIVYYVRLGRASSVQTKEQYEFIYRVASAYATKTTTPNNDN